jgi:hypothetical protein
VTPNTPGHYLSVNGAHEGASTGESAEPGLAGEEWGKGEDGNAPFE